jgi:hypothetical protein
MAWTCPCAALVSRLRPHSQLMLWSFRVWDIRVRNWSCVCGVVWPVLIKNERKANYHISRTQCADTIVGCICKCNRDCNCERVRNMRGVTHVMRSNCDSGSAQPTVLWCCRACACQLWTVTTLMHACMHMYVRVARAGMQPLKCTRHQARTHARTRSPDYYACTHLHDLLSTINHNNLLLLTLNWQSCTKPYLLGAHVCTFVVRALAVKQVSIKKHENILTNVASWL